AGGSRRSAIIDGPQLVLGPGDCPGCGCHLPRSSSVPAGSADGACDTLNVIPRVDRRELDLVERPGAQAGQPLDLLVVVVGDQDTMDAVLGRPGPGGMVEAHPGAAVGPGDVYRGVPGDRARADRAAQGLAPEIGQGGGIGAVDGQGGDTQ